MYMIWMHLSLKVEQRATLIIIIITIILFYQKIQKMQVKRIWQPLKKKYLRWKNSKPLKLIVVLFIYVKIIVDFFEDIFYCSKKCQKFFIYCIWRWHFKWPSKCFELKWTASLDNFNKKYSLPKKHLNHKKTL